MNQWVVFIDKALRERTWRSEDKDIENIGIRKSESLAIAYALCLANLLKSTAFYVIFPGGK